MVFDACLWNLNTGAAWRDRPKEFGPWQTVYHHYKHWSKTGLLERILTTLYARLEATRLYPDPRISTSVTRGIKHEHD
jgi:transposase